MKKYIEVLKKILTPKKRTDSSSRSVEEALRAFGYSAGLDGFVRTQDVRPAHPR